MAALLFDTSHLEYCSFANRLGLPMVALQRRQNIDPYLRQIHVLVDDQQRMVGFFTAGTLAEFSTVQAVSYYRDEMREMDAAYDAFIVANTAPADFLVSSLAIEERYRGQGLFNRLFDQIVPLAQAQACPRIVLTVWESNPALAMYLHKQFRIVATFDDALPLFFERLYLLEYDLTTESGS